VEVDPAPDPLARAEEVTPVDLGEVVDAVGGGDREVDRLAAGLGHRLEGGVGELDEVALDAAAMGEAQDRGAGLELAAFAGLVDEASARSRRLIGSSLSSRRASISPARSIDWVP
jgi:hypothetical protein